MPAKKTHFKLGLFVLATLVLLVGGIILLGAGALFKPTIKAETYFDGSVDGLEVGAVVKQRGVTVGKVTRIEFAGIKYREEVSIHGPDVGKYVMVEIALDADMFPLENHHQVGEILQRMVAQGLRVRITSAGLAGSSFLEADFLDPKQYPVLKVDWTPESIYIPSAPSQITQIANSIERIATGLEQANLGQTVQHLDKLIVDVTASINDLQVAGLREKMGSVLDELSLSSVRLTKLLSSPDIDAAIKDLPQISAGIKGSADRLNQILRDPALQDTLNSLAQVSSKANAATVDLRRMLRQTSDVVASESRDIEAIIGNLRRVSDNAAKASEEISKNPAQVIFSQPPPKKKPGEQP